MSYILSLVSVLIAILVIGGMVLWAWMLVDCLSRRDEDFPGKGSNDKLIWILVIILANVLGAFIYLIVVKLNSSKQKPPGSEDKRLS